MLKEFCRTIEQGKLFRKKSKLLLACSGGLDSVVLAHLLHKAGYTFTIAHCNFGLRGKESDRDEEFCASLAAKLNVFYYSKRMPTSTYAKSKGLSTQMAARELRYKWFEELKKEKGFEFLLTAHHLNDDIETMLLNLVRGTGLYGLKGMEVLKYGHVRPLLGFSRHELETTASEWKLKYRTDQSNFEEKYQRNYIRLKVIPRLKELNPSFEDTMHSNMRYLKGSAQLQKEMVQKWIGKKIKLKSNGWELKRNSLLRCPWRDLVVQELFTAHGFNSTQVEDACKAIGQKEKFAKFFYSGEQMIVVEKEFIRLTPRNVQVEEELFSDWSALLRSKQLKVEKLNSFAMPSKDQLLIERSGLLFPLKWRRWKSGDRIVPFGMKGSKLISDLLKEGGVGVSERKKSMVLENGNQDILWLEGIRSHERYRVNKKSKELILVQRRER